MKASGTTGRNGHARIHGQLVEASGGQQQPVPTSVGTGELELNPSQVAVLVQLARVLGGKDPERLTSETLRITFTEED